MSTKQTTPAYPFWYDDHSVCFFDAIGGIRADGQRWLQVFTWVTEDFQTGIPVEPRPISQEIIRKMDVLKKNHRKKELDHWLVLPTVVVQLFLEGLITQKQLKGMIVGNHNDYLCLPRTKFGKIVIEPDLPFQLAPSNVNGCLIPC